MFGEDMSLAVRLIFALVIILALIGGIVLILRRFNIGSLGSMSMHGRQPRLSVMDVAHLDSRRKLIIVRRDTVEHLIMVGGPNDVLIEQGIVRGHAAHGHEDRPATPVMPPMQKTQEPKAAAFQKSVAETQADLKTSEMKPLEPPTR